MTLTGYKQQKNTSQIHKQNCVPVFIVYLVSPYYVYYEDRDRLYNRRFILKKNNNKKRQQLRFVCYSNELSVIR